MTEGRLYFNKREYEQVERWMGLLIDELNDRCNPGETMNEDEKDEAALINALSIALIACAPRDLSVKP